MRIRRLKFKICETCGKEFKQRYTTSENKWKTIKFCSFKCRRYSDETKKKISDEHKNNPNTIRGEKHHNWKGGITKEHNKLRNSMEYVLWRNEVYKRDNWTCRICHTHCNKGNIVAHHLKKFSDYPELRFTTNNGLTLCRKCHAEIENPCHV